MRGVHFSLRWLFGVISFLALGCGMLIYASPFLSKLAFTAAVIVLSIAVVSAVYRTGERRAFWCGFAAFGLVYLWLVCGTWQSPDGSTSLRDRLITTDLLIRCHDVLPPRASSVSLVPPTPVVAGPVSYIGTMAVDPYGSTVQPGSPTSSGSFIYPLTVTSAFTTTVDRSDFLTTGHSLFLLLFALLGGTITGRCASHRKNSSTTQPTP